MADVTASGSRKRLKVSSACDECRRKKIKCDDAVPCLNCQRSYGDQAPRRCSKVLRERGTARPGASRAAGRISSAGAIDARRSASKTPLRPRNDGPVPDTSQHENRKALGNSTLGVIADDAHSAAHFGGSSVRSFLQRIQAMLQTDAETASASRSTESYWRNYFYGPALSVRVSVLDERLLARTFADQLLDTYWNRIHPLYPFLDRSLVDSDYNSLWAGSQTISDGPTIRCTVYTVLALTAQLSVQVRPSDRQALAERLYASGLESFNANATPSVASIQCYLLRAQYIQSTDDHEQFWLLTGSAARIAFGVGLHLPITSQQAPDEKSRQLLRRVWHGCVLMDRIAALTFGRPILVHECEVPLPDPSASSDLVSADDSSSTNVSPGASVGVGVFVETAKVFRIFHEALSGVYPMNIQTSKMEDYLSYLSSSRPGPQSGRLVLSLDFELVEWRKNLPHHLQHTSAPSREDTILRQRYLFLKIISLRPILSTYLHAETSGHALAEDLLALRYSHQSCLLCVELAQSSIDLICETPSDAQSEWWYNVLYLYVAGTVLVAAHLLDHVRASPADRVPGLEESWLKVMKMMEFYRPYRSNIERLRSTLEILWDALPVRYEEVRQARSAASQGHIPASVRSSGIGAVVSGDSSSRADLSDPHAQTAQMDNTSFDPHHIDWTALGIDLEDLSWLHNLPTFEEY